MPELPLPLLIVLIVVAIVAGLYVGGRAGQRELRSADGGGTREAKPVATRLRQAATDGMIRIWKWNRARNKPKKNPPNKNES